MNLHSLLAQRTDASGPVRVGVIGAGKFASMFLTQALNLDGIHVSGSACPRASRATAPLGGEVLAHMAAPSAFRAGAARSLASAWCAMGGWTTNVKRGGC
jgi:predicted homoserine dehydrogenase-like protein